MSKPLINIVTGQELATQPSQVTPGSYIHVQVAPPDVPRYGLVRMTRQADGSYIPVLKVMANHVRLDSTLAQRLGIPGLNQRSLERLVFAGFIESMRPSPKVTIISIDSLAQHLEAARDPEFWTSERLAQYRDSWKS